MICGKNVLTNKCLILCFNKICCTLAEKRTIQTEQELSTFLGIMIFSGYYSVPSERDYWSQQSDLNVPLVSSAMSRNRFQKIKSADNENLSTGNKVSKVQKYYDIFNQNLTKFGTFHHGLSIELSIVPYHRTHV